MNPNEIFGYTPNTNVPIYRSVDAAEAHFDYARWPDFSPRELACRGSRRVAWVPEALDQLQALRTAIGKPMIVTSAYRSPSHNAAVRGASGSRHMEGDAYDVSMDNHDPHAFKAAAISGGFDGIGTYPTHNFIHVDNRGVKKRWGAAFPASQVAFSGAEEAHPAPIAPTAGVATAGVGAGVVGTGALLAAVPHGSAIIREIGGLSSTVQTIVVVVAVVALLLAVVVGPSRMRRFVARRWSGDDL